MFASSAKSVFSKNVAGVGGGMTAYSAGPAAVASTSAPAAAPASIYTALSQYVESISIIFEVYKMGNFYQVANILTKTVYNRYAVQLSNLSEDPNKYRDYETLRISCVNALHGMYQGIQQYAKILDLQHALELCEEYEAILRDPVRLNAYIAELNQPKFAFPNSTVTTIAATLKPEYAEYIALYGYPAGGVFDMEKLAAILKQQMFNL